MAAWAAWFGKSPFDCKANQRQDAETGQERHSFDNPELTLRLNIKPPENNSSPDQAANPDNARARAPGQLPVPLDTRIELGPVKQSLLRIALLKAKNRSIANHSFSTCPAIPRYTNVTTILNYAAASATREKVAGNPDE